MEEDKRIKEAINLMAEHERVIGELYRTYANLFGDKDFWMGLANEEDLHAKWLLSFFENVYNGKVQLGDSYNREAVWQSIKHVKNLIKDAPNYGKNMAVAYAFAIENTVLEKDFINIFDENEPAVQEILIRLTKGTQSHRDRIEAKFITLLRDIPKNA
ncbi:MAG: hypothetical protein BWY68_00390 [bacterium ADurb.Bin400]|nr:MAG: hypothetical protein BWY68_00390 [bacterium ADurb.Bin400]